VDRSELPTAGFCRRLAARDDPAELGNVSQVPEVAAVEALRAGSGIWEPELWKLRDGCRI